MAQLFGRELFLALGSERMDRKRCRFVSNLNSRTFGRLSKRKDRGNLLAPKFYSWMGMNWRMSCLPIIGIILACMS